MRLFDAHNHLQDIQFDKKVNKIMSDCNHIGLTRMVTNGTNENDWKTLSTLAKVYSQVIPSFGLHPWFINDRSSNWFKLLEQKIDNHNGAVGEIGLDLSRKNLQYNEQKEVFLSQLQLSADRNIPVSIHCIKAWNQIYNLLSDNQLPKRGFLLHGFSGPAEMINPLTNLGAYFSFSGSFAHANKSRQRNNFCKIPINRILIESDAPFQPMPDNFITHPLKQKINHPANIKSIYKFAAECIRIPYEELTVIVEKNFLKLFGNQLL